MRACFDSLFRSICFVFCAVALPLTSSVVGAAEPSTTSGELAQRVEELKLDAVSLARDVWLLENSLGGDAHQLVVFVSVDPKIADRVEQVEVMLGEDTVAQHDYSSAEADALHKGGAHRIFSSSLAPGRHVLEARLRAQGDAGSFKQTAKLSFRVEAPAKTIELRLQETDPGLAELIIREWD